MSRLVNPGAGDISDRLTILSLKILYATEAGKDASFFKTEKASLLVLIRARTLNAKWFEAYTELSAVNAALWQAEDDLREWRAVEHRGDHLAQGSIADLACQIQAWNDQRAALIDQINKEAGDQLGTEKL